MNKIKSNYMNGREYIMEDLLNNDGNLSKTKFYTECINPVRNNKYSNWVRSLPKAIRYIFIPIVYAISYMIFVKYCIKVGKTL